MFRNLMRWKSRASGLVGENPPPDAGRVIRGNFVCSVADSVYTRACLPDSSIHLTIQRVSLLSLPGW